MVVTGGSGFLGSHLAQVLLEEEPELRELRILDLNPDPGIVPEKHRSRVRLFQGDIGDFGADFGLNFDLNFDLNFSDFGLIFGVNFSDFGVNFGAKFAECWAKFGG
ncbi:hypothetical protein HGM15179_020958 [Zosterops borbonicus]|uniref:3-beta hydroxysteroid dehydrogenase/isomerase domain-containing protein n=1 Tax=Zosterops borbonicus TaxID=364589 RepID=A0A8K1D5E2_9PASS|nr:hypothetical protein HGM15179_020958 [Zosterops borbonicus]